MSRWPQASRVLAGLFVPGEHIPFVRILRVRRAPGRSLPLPGN
jgi:hypothetical protein